MCTSDKSYVKKFSFKYITDTTNYKTGLRRHVSAIFRISGIPDGEDFFLVTHSVLTVFDILPGVLYKYSTDDMYRIILKQTYNAALLYNKIIVQEINTL